MAAAAWYWELGDHLGAGRIFTSRRGLRRWAQAAAGRPWHTACPRSPVLTLRLVPPDSITHRYARREPLVWAMAAHPSLSVPGEIPWDGALAGYSPWSEWGG